MHHFLELVDKEPIKQHLKQLNNDDQLHLQLPPLFKIDNVSPDELWLHF